MSRCIHFVGFKGDDYVRACRVFGKPDFIQRMHDQRAISMFAPDDMIVFANGSDTPTTSVFSFDDSSVM